MSSGGAVTAPSIRSGGLPVLLLLLSFLLLPLPTSPRASVTSAADDDATADVVGADGDGDGDGDNGDVLVLVKLGGSSITDKSKIETVNSTMLHWAADAISSAMVGGNGRNVRFVVVHGAGSFGHFVAKEYGLRGQVDPPPSPGRKGEDEDGADVERDRMKEEDRRLGHHSRTKMMMTGLARTRLSVQRLNLHVVDHLLRLGVPAVSVSPCFSVPNMRAHGGGGDEDDGAGGHGDGDGGPSDAMTELVRVVREAVDAGLVPVLHGDACLYGVDSDGRWVQDVDAAGILGGDTLMSAIATHPLLADAAVGDVRAVFLTDVDGVYTSDPNANPDAELLRTIEVDRDGTVVSGSTSASNVGSSSSSGTEEGVTTGVVIDGGGGGGGGGGCGTDEGVCVDATGSRHEHDVTGGLRTKLRAAADIARRGIEVRIARCGSPSAERALRVKVNAKTGTMRPDGDGGAGEDDGDPAERGTVVRLRRE